MNISENIPNKIPVLPLNDKLWNWEFNLKKLDETSIYEKISNKKMNFSTIKCY